MKKSLSLLLAFAMVFSMFSSLAFAADTELTAQQKYDALAAKGIFTGVNEAGDAGLDQNMNRAQFARVAALIRGLEGIGNPDTKVVTEKPFSDVELGTWYVEEIAAAKEAGLFEGNTDGTFNPKGNISVQELAVVVAKLFSLEPVADATVEGAADWAAGYVQAVINAGVDFPTNYTEPAIRADLASLAFQADAAINPVAPAKVSVNAANPTGAKEVTVTLDKAVDDSKATLSLKKGSVAVATTTKFADDKKSATLTLTSTKISEGEYTVTLAGLAAEEVDVTTASFTAQNERVTNIEFVNASEYLARTNKNIVKIKASNQYGEAATASAGSYEVMAGRNNDVYVKLTKDELTGDLLLTLDTTIQDGVAPNNFDRYQAGTGIIPVNIYNTDTHISASKNFKMGTTPFISKMEISEVKYSNGKDYLGAKGENAIINVYQYDQYGNQVAYTTDDDTNIRFVLNGYEPELGAATIGDSNNDDIADVKVALTNNVDKDNEYSFNIFNQAGSATGKLVLKSGKTANKVQFGDLSDVVAAGDTDAYVPVVAYDANGDQLSVDDLVNAQNTGRISFNHSGLTGGTPIQFVTFGEHKGKLKLTGIPTSPRSVIAVTAIIAEANANSVSTKTITVADVRIPDHFYVDKNPKQKIVNGADSEVKVFVYDQYGKKLGEAKNVTAAGNVTTDPAGTAGVTSYSVVVDKALTGANIDLTQGGASMAASTPYTGAALATFNDGQKFVAAGAVTAADSATFTAKIMKQVGTGTPVEVSKIVRKIEGTEDTLSYTVSTVANLYNAIDTGSVTNATYGSGTLTIATQEDPLTSKFARDISLSAIDGAGNTVAVPNTIKQLTSSNPVIARTAVNTSNNKGYVIGNKAGTATLNVTFTTNKGLQLLQTLTVTVKDDVITSTKLDRGNGTITLANAGTGNNAFTAMNVKVTDNYGITFEGADAQKYNYLFGVTFTATNVIGGGSVQVNQYGVITITGTVTSYELTATSAAGFSASSFVN